MKARGFALIEVLVALMIIALALGGLLQTNSAVIRNIDLFEKKSEALWVAENIANEIQIGLLSLPTDLSELKGTMMMLNHQWYWQVSFEKTADRAAFKVTIDIQAIKEGPTVLQYITYVAPKGERHA